MEQTTQEMPQYPVIDLFPDDASPHEPEPGQPGVNEYRRAFRAIAWYRRIADTATADEEKVLEQIRRETENVKTFYENKRTQSNQRIALWLSQLDAMMKLNGVEKMATPYGTSFYRTTRTKEWRPEDELLSFARETGEKDLLHIKETPNKKMIEAYIESTGKGEHLLTVTPKTEVAVRIKEEGE